SCSQRQESAAFCDTGAASVASGRGGPCRPTQCTWVHYVLDGSIVMQVKGGKQVTLTPGQTLHEGPADVHHFASRPRERSSPRRKIAGERIRRLDPRWPSHPRSASP